jgi:hypothetical protein
MEETRRSRCHESEEGFRLRKLGLKLSSSA